jgi:hypothetical protein
MIFCLRFHLNFTILTDFYEGIICFDTISRKISLFESQIIYHLAVLAAFNDP